MTNNNWNEKQERFASLSLEYEASTLGPEPSGLPSSEAVGHKVEARAWGLISVEESKASVGTGSRQVLGAWATLLRCERRPEG